MDWANQEVSAAKVRAGLKAIWSRHAFESFARCSPADDLTALGYSYSSRNQAQGHPTASFVPWRGKEKKMWEEKRRQ